MAEGLRERKKAETRKALSSAALRLALEHGPEGVTVEAIAEAAGVSPRTFFNYFPSKDDAIVDIAPSEPSQLLADLVERPADEPPLEALRQVALAAADRLTDSADEMWARYELSQAHEPLAMRRSARYAAIERSLAEEIARRTGFDVDRHPYPALVATAAMRAIMVAVSVWNEQGRTRPLRDVIDEAFDHLADGLVAAPTPAAAR